MNFSLKLIGVFCVLIFPLHANTKLLIEDHVKERRIWHSLTEQTSTEVSYSCGEGVIVFRKLLKKITILMKTNKKLTTLYSGDLQTLSELDDDTVVFSSDKITITKSAMPINFKR